VVVKGEGDPNHAAFELLAYTGARRREITELRWSEVDLDAATITLPPERRKTGKKDPHPFVINLHPAALDVIKRQPVLDGSPFVLWGRRDHSAFDFQRRPHDLRRYMRTGLTRIGVTRAVAEQCLGHKVDGLVGVYDQRSYSAEKADAWRRWGDHLAQLTGREVGSP
jgi:integrase